MLTHYELMRGLALIFHMRFGKYLDIVEEQRSKNRSEDEMMQAIRHETRLQAALDPKPRMLFIEDKEADLYVWGPMQLFFCIAWAYLHRYRYLRRKHPNLVLDELERYIKDHSDGLDAIGTLRDWVLHPGVGRRPDDAMERLFSVRDGWHTAYPMNMVNCLIELAEEFLAKLGREVERLDGSVG